MMKVLKDFPEVLKNWVIGQEWPTLYKIQEEAFRQIPIEPTKALTDFILSSETASGKTEAIYLPLLARLIKKDEISHSNGYNLLYISPLVALINDQYKRLEPLSNLLDLSVVMRHSGRWFPNKSTAETATNGILLTTPESLEGLLVRSEQDSAEINKLTGIHAIIIDELHAFFEVARGRHLQSLLHRLEAHFNGKYIPRIALSATLGNAIDTSLEVLRPKYQNQNNPKPVTLFGFDSPDSSAEITLKVFFDPVQRENENNGFDQMVQAIHHDFKDLDRGLIFSNSRAGVETTFELINEIAGNSLELGKISSFARHHSSVPGKERREVEKLMKGDEVEGLDPLDKMTTICTNTLELGIDIGKVEMVGQIDSTFSVAALRQRIGRSGRGMDTDASGVLYTIENQITDEEHPLDALKLKTFQAAATINLAISGKFEKPSQRHLHLSTLVHQILSMIHQQGQITTRKSYNLLVKNGPWDEHIIDYNFYKRFLESLTEGRYKLISQSSKGFWTLPPQTTNQKPRRHASGVFSTPSQYTVVYHNRTVGQLPMTVQYRSGDTFILNRGRWKVLTVSDENQRLLVTKVPSAGAPRFGGSAQAPSALIVREMYDLYTGRSKFKGIANKEAKQSIQHGIESFNQLNMHVSKIMKRDNDVMIFPWCGARRSQTLLLLLRREGLRASNHSFSILIENTDIKHVKEKLSIIKNDLNQNGLDLDELARESLQLKFEKYDGYFSPYHKRLAYSKNFLSERDMVALISEILESESA